MSPEWLNKEESRAKNQSKKGQVTANPTAPRLVKTKASAPKARRILKGLRIKEDLVAKFDVLVAEQKNKSGKNGTTLADEAIELLLSKYKKLTG